MVRIFLNRKLFDKVCEIILGVAYQTVHEYIGRCKDWHEALSQVYNTLWHLKAHAVTSVTQSKFKIYQITAGVFRQIHDNVLYLEQECPVPSAQKKAMSLCRHVRKGVAPSHSWSTAKIIVTKTSSKLSCRFCFLIGFVLLRFQSHIFASEDGLLIQVMQI